MALADYFNDIETIKSCAEEADCDSDAVSIDYLLPTSEGETSAERVDMALAGEPIEGAILFIKGDAVVREFIEWARSRGYLHRKPWRDRDVA